MTAPPATFRSPTSAATRSRSFTAPDGSRLTALINPALTDRAGRPFGQLGFLELSEDQSAARALVAAALGWLAGQPAGPRQVLAPMNGDAWHDYRLMVAGFEQPAFPGEPRNQAWLPDFLEEAGFRTFSEHETRTVADPAALLATWEPLARRMQRRGFRFEAVAAADLEAVLGRAHRLSLAVFRQLPLFTALPEEDFRALYAGARALLEGGGLTFARGPDGADLGLCFAFRLPGAPADLYLKSFGLLERWRGSGLAAAFLAQVYGLWLERGVTRVHHCLMNSQEAAARFDRGAGRVSRRYRLYARPLDGAAAAP